jgi:hypothetical protein
VNLLALGTHLHVLSPPGTLNCKALRVLHARGREGLPLHRRGSKSAAAPVATAAAEGLDAHSAAAPVATATAESLDLGALAAATAAPLDLNLGLPVLTAAMAARASIGRGRNRESGNARCEKHPGHHNFSFRTARTVSPLHRSNT